MQPPKKIGFTPKFQEVLCCDADIIGLGGGKGGSKTYGVVLDSLYKCSNCPGLRVAYVRRDWSHSEEVRAELGQMVRDYFTEYDDNGRVTYCVCERPDDPVISDSVRFKNGSKIILLNCHDWASAAKLHGKSYHIFIFDEVSQFPPGVIEFARLGKRVKDDLGIRTLEWLITNPEGDCGDFVSLFHVDGTTCSHPNAKLIGKDLWAWEEVVQMPEAIGGGTETVKFAFQHSTYEDNIYLDRRQYYAKTFSNIKDDKLRERMVKGNFNALSGSVLRGFDPDVHTYDPDDPEEIVSDHALLLGGGDWGDNAPAVLLPAVLDVNHEVRIIGELYDIFDTSEQFALAASTRFVRDYAPIYCWLTWLDVPYAMDTQIFAAGKGWKAGQSTGTRLRDDYGFTFVPTNKRVEPAIQILRDLFAVNPATGRPYLRISKKCVNLIKEIPRWTYDEFGKPSKAADLHSLAALRYLVSSHRANLFPRVTKDKDPVKLLHDTIAKQEYSTLVEDVSIKQVTVGTEVGRSYRGSRKIEAYSGE